jgi:hypothetical protein
MTGTIEGIVRFRRSEREPRQESAGEQTVLPGEGKA